MSSLQTMYPAVANSPQVTIVETITDTDTTIKVDSPLPPPPNLLVIGRDEDCETVLYKVFDSTTNTITDCERGFQGTAKGWLAGTKASRNFTAYDHDAFVTNILSLDDEIDTAAAQATANANAYTDQKVAGVTKESIGLGNVENYGIATQEEAEAGTVNNKYMTPLRVAQAITIRAPKASRSAAIVIAAADASAASKAGADYVCTGVNDHELINDVLYYFSSGGEVVLTEGHFIITRSILIPNNTWLRGSGYGTRIMMGPSASGRHRMFDNEYTDGYGITVSDLIIDGNKANTPATADAIGFSSVTHFNVERVLIYNCKGAGMLIRDSAHGLLHGCTLLSSDLGIEIINSAQMRVDSNSIDTMNQSGIRCGGSRNSVTNNIIVSTYDGISLDGNDCNVLGNRLDNSYRTGIYISGGWNNVQNNVCIRSGNEGIRVFMGASTNLVTNNVVIGNGAAGILDQGTNTTMTPGNWV